LAEASLKSRELLEAVAGALPQAGDALDAVAREHIATGVAEVKAALAAGELRRLKAANAALDAATETLAAVLVERAMEEALARRMGG
jgi:molecular chaperone DnaK